MCVNTCKVISFALAKGGTTKSTSTINIGAALSSHGYKVAIIDNDPQGNLSTALGHDPKSFKHTLATKMLNVLDDSDGPPIEDCMVKFDAFDMLPSNQKLGLVEKRLTMESGTSVFSDGAELPAELVMRKALEPLKKLYHFILIDNPPSVGMLTINAMAASDSVLMPMESHFLGFEAVKLTLDVIARVKRSLNPNLCVEGILLTKFQDRTTLCRSIRKSVFETYGESLHVFSEPIAYSIKAAEQSLCGLNIFETDPHGKTAAGYKAAALEVIAHHA